MMYGYGFGFWGMILSMVITVLILIGLVWLVVWAVRSTSHSSNALNSMGTSPSPHTAREVLDQRYARGEITREQYQQMKQDLES